MSSDQNTRFKFRRRDLLKFTVLTSLGYVGLKGVLGSLINPERYGRTPDGALRYLSFHDASIVLAASSAIVGTLGHAALQSGDWRPDFHADQLLAYLGAQERKLASIGLKLFEHGSVDITGFSRKNVSEQLAQLEEWRTSDLELKRSVWGLLHAIASTSFASTQSGWFVMGYDGPCRSDVGYPGRVPGQTARFDWDASVP